MRWTGGLAGLLGGVGVIVVLAQQQPDYPHGDFVEECTVCHDETGWLVDDPGARFDHAGQGFALRGAHTRATCMACHRSLDFSQASDACVTCHMDIHQGELGVDCGRCHTANNFIDRSRMTRAHVATRFPLRGAHLPADCEDCHEPAAQGQNQYVNTPTECASCHLDEYLSAADPDHAASGFSTDCQTCHVPTTWNRFIHTSQLDCVTCHLDDYQATTNPDHQAVGFDTDCINCHKTTTWRFGGGGGFNHDGPFFPIYSGKHRGKWSECVDCHVTPSNFANFECIFCHEHDNPTDLADDHSDVSGYQYLSQACYTCHPRGDS